MRSSTCPDPYSAPVMGAWMTTTNTCVKSVSNPTNPASPVSPLNPASPVNPTAMAPSMPLPTATPTPPQVGQTPGLPSAPVAEAPKVESKTETKTETKQESKTEDKPTSTDGKGAQTQGSSAPRKTVPAQSASAMTRNSAVARALSLELFNKPQLHQPNFFPEANINQQFPRELTLNQDLMMEMLGIKKIDQTEKFNDLIPLGIDF